MEKKNRLSQLDLARGFAVLCMFAVHILQTLSDKQEVRKSLFGRIVEFLGGAPAAPTFMFLMGMGLAASHKTLGTQAKRGFLLMFGGYALNFARATLPIQLGAPYPGDPWEFFWMVDILQFAGFTLLLFPLLQKLPLWALGALFLGVSFFSPFLWGLTPDAHALVDILWGKHPRVFFPVFPWLAFPLAGILHAKLRPQRSRSVFLIIGFLFIMAGVPLHKFLWDETVFSYYHASPGAIFWMTGFTILWLEVCDFLAPRIGRIIHFFRFWSENVTTAYAFSWVLIVWCTFLTGYRSLNLVPTILAMLLIPACTAALIHAYKYLKSLAFKP
jgi:hypothetical protein